ncbi:MAG: phospho-sugar mutase, partial [Prolixibacteraceae bacterium]|nr:phospho-sugar mutase [Prolixibacteraceae bacterium]
GCQSGIILTASHNPPEYNGYKAYWDDGAQVTAPHDTAIIEEVKRIKPQDIKFDGQKELIQLLGDEADRKYIDRVKTISLSPETVAQYHDLKIVYTPIHGTGFKLVPMALQAFGFTHIIHVPEQDVISGNFPTVASPNPEEPAAMKMGIEKAVETDAEVVMATDPDSDRLGVAVRNLKNEFEIINGNQTALLFVYYIITRMREKKMLRGDEFIVKTIVSTELIKEIALRNHIEYYDVYTGFKYIAEVIRENEGVKKYIGGGEESFGFLPEDFVRDKDAVSSIALMAEIVAWAKSRGKTLYELLLDIYIEYGYSKEAMFSITRKGQSGAKEIKRMMEQFRSNPPKDLDGAQIELMKDFDTLEQKNLITGKTEPIAQKTTSNVLQFFAVDGTKVSARPSGTEPKIKFYFEVKGELKSYADFDKTEKLAAEKIERLMSELGSV